jgi:hypothetical protein
MYIVSSTFLIILRKTRVRRTDENIKISLYYNRLNTLRFITNQVLERYGRVVDSVGLVHQRPVDQFFKGPPKNVHDILLK